MPVTAFLSRLQQTARSLCGEFLSPRDMLDAFAPPGDATPPAAPRRRVVLAVEGASPSPAALRYALQACARADADLDLLFVGLDAAPLVPGIPAGTRVRRLHRPGPLGERVAEHARRCPDLLVVITSDTVDPHALWSARAQRGVEVPVVVLDAVA